MPTIAPAAPRSPSLPTAGKAIASILEIGGSPPVFADMLAGSVVTAPDAAATPAVALDVPAILVADRQPVAAPGTPLPDLATLAPAIEAPTPAPDEPVTSPEALSVAQPAPVADPSEPLLIVAKRATPDAPADDEAPATQDEATPMPAPVVIVPAPPVALPTPPDVKTATTAPGAILSTAPRTGREMRWTTAAPTPDMPRATEQPTVSLPAAVASPEPIAAERAAPTRIELPPAATDPVAVPLTRPTAPATTLRAAMPSELPKLDLPPAAPAPLPAMQAVAAAPPIVTGPALQVFGAAISAAARREQPDRPGSDPATLPLGIAAPAAAATTTIADTSGQPLLDMRQERWPHAMIAQIEHLRDTANASDTRIRLIPDALGTIDIAVAREGDTLNVRFTADQPATRTLIQDAQPRLAAIAEERGLRLGQTAVDGGTAGSTPQQQRQPQRDATASPAPRRAATTTHDHHQADTGRLA